LRWKKTLRKPLLGLPGGKKQMISDYNDKQRYYLKRLQNSFLFALRTEQELERINKKRIEILRERPEIEGTNQDKNLIKDINKTNNILKKEKERVGHILIQLLKNAEKKHNEEMINEILGKTSKL
jgi:CRISPR/Cas system-associated endoribonuclease Cas2